MDQMCCECHKAPADKAPRTYKDLSTGKVYKTVRNHCSDLCEQAYHLKMAAAHPKAFNNLLRVA